MGLGATLLDSTGLRREGASRGSHALWVSGAHSFCQLQPSQELWSWMSPRACRALLAQINQTRGPVCSGSGIKRDAFGVVGNSCLFSSITSETHLCSLVYVINLLWEARFINCRLAVA